MKNITRFKWNINNVEHIAKHGVTPNEIEEVTFENKVFVRSGRERLHYLLGTTQAGRYLFIVVALTKRKGEAVVITARDMTENERKYYQKRGR